MSRNIITGTVNRWRPTASLLPANQFFCLLSNGQFRASSLDHHIQLAYLLHLLLLLFVQVEFATMSAADLQEKALNHALHVMFEHCKDPQPLITFGTQLKNQKMYEVLKEVSFAALERINVLEQTRRDRVLRLKEITYLLSKTPLPDQRLNLEKQIYDSLPLYVRHDEHTHHSMNLQVVQLIVAAILDKREDQRVSQLNSSLVRTIDLTVVEEELLQVGGRQQIQILSDF